MLLYVLTTVGGEREDANVFHAAYLMVEAPKSRQAAVNRALATILGCTTQFDLDKEQMQPFHGHPHKVADALTRAGYPAQVLKAEIICGEE